jgi:hypothetical protein
LSLSEWVKTVITGEFIRMYKKKSSRSILMGNLGIRLKRPRNVRIKEV